MRIFVLEDDEERIALFTSELAEHDLTVARDVTEAQRKWKPPYHVVCLDHDLGGFVSSGHENTGAAFVRDLVKATNLTAMASAFFVHSWNPDGAQLMANLLVEAGAICLKIPFGPSLFAMLEHFSRPYE